MTICGPYATHVRYPETGPLAASSCFSTCVTWYLAIFGEDWHPRNKHDQWLSTYTWLTQWSLLFIKEFFQQTNWTVPINIKKKHWEFHKQKLRKPRIMQTITNNNTFQPTNIGMHSSEKNGWYMITVQKAHSWKTVKTITIDMMRYIINRHKPSKYHPSAIQVRNHLWII